MDTQPKPGKATETNAQAAPAPEEALPTKPNIIVKLARGNLEALLMLVRTSTNTLNPTEEDIRAALAEQGVTHGINEALIKEMLKWPVYNQQMVIARGAQAQTGADGHVVMLFETGREMRPKIREDGTADFKDLGLIQNVRAGDALCEVHPPEQGADGLDVQGKVLEGLYGKEAVLPIGQNVALNEEKNKIVALVDGNVEYRKKLVNVLDVMRIGGNVDNSTGDIDFVGSVIINGYVLSGFKVKSKGDIVIKGGVEGATIEATGNITVNESVNGMNNGSLRAGGNIKCKYIQGCYLYAEKNIYADTIMYCNLECSGDVELSGKRATLIGGRSSIAGKLVAKGIGTESHVGTEIIMASSGLNSDKQIAVLNKKSKDLDMEINKLVQVMNRFEDLQKLGRVNEEQQSMLAQIKTSYVDLMRQRKEAAARIEEIKQEQLEAAGKNSHIECKGRIHTGVRITFGPLNMMVRESFVNSRVHTVDGEITISPL